MCLSVPSEVVALHPDEQAITVDTLGVRRKVSRHLLSDDIQIGDYVLIHIGFAMNKIDKEDALESLKLYREIAAKLEAENHV